MSVLDNAKKHFGDKISGGMKSYWCEEWETEVYYRPVNSFAVETKIIELTQKGRSVEALVETLLLKALDKDGKALFARADKATFMNQVDPAVITKVVTAINANDVVEYEAVEKN